MQRALASGRSPATVRRPPSVLASASSSAPAPRAPRAVAVAPRRRCQRRTPTAARASADGDGNADGAPSTTATTSTSSSSSSSSSSSDSSDQQPKQPQQQQQQQQPPRKRRQADSTDAVASFLTRRFGIAGGLAWLGVLTFGVVSEQLKTRREQREEAEGTRDAGAAAAQERPLPGLGAAYKELRVGGGGRPQRGDLVVLEFSARYSADGGLTYADPPFVDTAAKRPVVLVWGARPLAPVIAPAVEAAIEDGMRAGGRRVVTVSPGAKGGFGGSPPPGVPQGGVALQYDVTLSRVSVAPS